MIVSEACIQSDPHPAFGPRNEASKGSTQIEEFGFMV